MCPKLDKKQDGVQQSLVGFLSPPTRNLSDSASQCSYSPSTPDRASLQSSTFHTYSDSTSSYPPTPSTSDRSDLPSTSQNSDHEIVDKSLPGDQYYSIDDSQSLSSDPLTLHSENHQVFLNAPLSTPSPQ